MNIHLKAALQTTMFLASAIGFCASVLFAPFWFSMSLVVAVLGFSIWKMYESNVEVIRIKKEQQERSDR